MAPEFWTRSERKRAFELRAEIEWRADQDDALAVAYCDWEDWTR